MISTLINEIKSLAPEVMHTLTVLAVIVFGAIVHATAQLKISRDKNLEFTKADFLILFVIGTFSGLVFGITADIVWDDNLIMILSSAIGAFLGMAGLNKIASFLLDVAISSLKKGSK